MIRRISFPERTRSLPNRNPNLRNKDFAANPPIWIERSHGCVHQRTGLQHSRVIPSVSRQGKTSKPERFRNECDPEQPRGKAWHRRVTAGGRMGLMARKVSVVIKQDEYGCYA